MTTAIQQTPEIQVSPASAERWQDIETLFGTRGAYSGCWCMFWRMKRKDFANLHGEGTREALKELTCSNKVPGLLAYLDGKPIGWCSLGPREDFKALENSRSLRRVDDTPTWSMVCFFIAKPYRKKGVMTQLVKAAVEYAARNHAQAVEAYPIDLQSHLLTGKTLTGYSGYMGIASVFREAGFEKVADASETQLIMRYGITKKVNHGTYR